MHSNGTVLSILTFEEQLNVVLIANKGIALFHQLKAVRVHPERIAQALTATIPCRVVTEKQATIGSSKSTIDSNGTIDNVSKIDAKTLPHPR
jgi:hypothetical protein